MNTKIVAKNITVTEEIRDYLEKRLARFEKMLGGFDEAFVNITAQKKTVKVEITVPMSGVILRGEDTSEEVFSAIDGIVDKLEAQVRKHKTKLAKKMKEGSAGRRVIMELPEENPVYDVVKIKSFSAKPYSLDEAIMQLDLLGHDFFVFVNAENSQVNVLYKRKGGNYGLLEPEM